MLKAESFAAAHRIRDYNSVVCFNDRGTWTVDLSFRYMINGCRVGRERSSSICKCYHSPNT